MIVISGALVLVALVLLVIGVVDPSLPFVYASIAVSLVSLVFLVIGILQRRNEPASGAADAAAQPAPEAETEPAEKGESVTAVIPAQAGSRRVKAEAEPEPEPPVDEDAEAELETGGTVLVVNGRPRYHVEGCRYLTGKEAEAVDVLDARDEGFTACGVCRPDEALEAPLAVEDEEAFDELEDATVVEGNELDDEQVEDEELEDEPEPEPQPVPAPARRTAAKQAGSRKAPAKKATKATMTRAVPADPLEEVAAGRGAKASKASPAKAAAPAKASRAKAAAASAQDRTPATSTARRTGSVVVIPDRNRFHKSECRYVRGVEDASVLTKAQAAKQGYEACGVCKP